MVAVYPLQSSFSGGELSPRLSARTDSDFYQKAVAIAQNYFALPQGSLFKRPGTEYVMQTYNNTRVRLKEFTQSRGEDYIAEFGAGYIRMFNREGTVQAAGAEALLNREFYQGPNGLKYWTFTNFFTQEIDVGGEMVETEVMDYVITPPQFRINALDGAEGLDNPPDNWAQLYQSTTIDMALDHTFRVDFGTDGWPYNTFSLQVKVGDGVTDDAYGDFTYTTPGIKEIPAFTPTTTTCEITLRFELAATPTTAPTYAYVQDLRLRPSSDDPLIISTGVPTINDSVPWTEEEVFELEFAMDLGGGDDGPDRLWIVHPNYPPHVLIRISQNDWTCVDLVAGPAPIFTDPPPDWTVGNFPSTIDLFSGRSWFSGVPDSRSQLWASKAGNYYVFTAYANPGDAFDLQLITRGAVQWLKGQKAMLIGTDLGEHVISSSTGYRALAVGDIDVTEQSGNGSVPVEPIIIGHEVLYVSPDRTKVYTTDYVRDSDGWVSTDLTWVAEHITREGVAFQAWARDPNNQLLFIMQDGTLRSCVYDKQFQTIGWSRFNAAGWTEENKENGFYWSLAITNDIGGSGQWYCVQRGDSYNIETVQAGEINNQYMDSWLAVATVDNVVSGLEHLEGMTVQVLVEGAIEPDKVVTGGQITTQANGNAVVGLQFDAYCKTLRREGGNQAGTSQASMMAFQKIFLRVNNSAVPKVNGQRPPLRDPQTPMNTPTPLLTGDTVTWNLGTDTGGVIEILQDLPLRTEIVAIFGKMRSSVI